MSDLMEFAKVGVEEVGSRLAPDEDWGHMMFVDGREGMGVVAVPSAGGSYEERDFLWESVVPSLLVDFGARAVVTVTSAWLREQVEGSDEEGRIPASELPLNRPDDRLDVLVLVYVDRDVERFEVAEVKRYPDHHPELVWRDDLTSGPDATLGGRLVGGIRRGLIEA